MILVSQSRRRHFPYETAYGVRAEAGAYCEDNDTTYPWGIVDVNTCVCIAGYETEAQALCELDHILKAYESGVKVYRI